MYACDCCISLINITQIFFTLYRTGVRSSTNGLDVKESMYLLSRPRKDLMLVNLFFFLCLSDFVC